MITVFYLPSKANCKRFKTRLCWRKTPEDDNVKINFSPKLPCTFLPFKSSAFLPICLLTKRSFQFCTDANFFSCTQSESNKHLLVPITVEDEVSFTNKYSLIPTINHSGTLNRGHYWAFTRDLHSSSWYSCNDKLVFNIEERSLNNTTS